MTRCLSGALLLLAAVLPGRAATDPAAPPPPRLAFNTGLARVKEGRWSDAERAFMTALASQESRLRTPALYHLGLARFAQGEDAQKRAQDPEAARRAVSVQTDSLAFLTGAALAAAERPDPDELRSIYRAGRQALKLAKQREPAFRQIIEAHEAVLAKWQRASADFKSALELDANDADAAFNAAVVDEHIRRLLEKLEPLQQEMQQSGKQQAGLKGALQQVKQVMPPGAKGEGESEEDDDEGEDGDQSQGNAQPPSRDGKESGISPDEAARLLNGFQPGGTRPLPVTTGRSEKPVERKGRDW